ncbi:hypothetical protein HUS23_13795 [Ectothiorhodospiraceae bacterium 2226]|nr:hypothetical protein HUS23_13795 [Ectothiorhodospiraceae bacterium 2226]
MGRLAAWLGALALVSVYISPRLGAHVTATDLLLVLAALVVPFVLPRLWRISGGLPVLLGIAFLVYAFLVTVAMYPIIGTSVVRSSLFGARLIEAFVMFAIAVYLGYTRPRLFLSAVGLGAGIVIVYGLFQIVTGRFSGYYGYIGLLGERGPSQAGAVIYLTFVSLLFLGYLFRRGMFTLGAVLVIFLLVGTISRTALVALVAVSTVGLVVVWLAGSRRLAWYQHRITLLLFLGVLISGAAAIQFLPDLMDRVAHRASASDSGISIRMAKWQGQIDQLNAVSPLLWLSGAGLGSYQHLAQKETTRLGLDSQYMWLMMEVGVVGALLWLGWLGTIILRIYRCNPQIGHFAFLMLFGMLVMGITHEIFLVGKPSMLFFALLGGALGLAAQMREAGQHHELSPLRRVSGWGRSV